MKKLILTAAMIIGLSAVTLAEANDHIFSTNVFETELSLKALKGLKFQVTASNVQEKSILEIKDAKGVILYKAAVKDADYVKVFDLSTLPDGNYSLELSKGAVKTVKSFEIKTETTRSVSNI